MQGHGLGEFLHQPAEFADFRRQRVALRARPPGRILIVDRIHPSADFGHLAGEIQKFIDSGYNLKVVFKELVKTPYYRAYNAKDLDEARELELAQLGTGRLLIPEQLHRKVEAVTGQPWRTREGDGGTDLLLDADAYRIFYGGIDSDTVVQRITDPNGIMANVAKRMSNEIACWTTAADFTREPGDRNLPPPKRL